MKSLFRSFSFILLMAGMTAPGFSQILLDHPILARLDAEIHHGFLLAGQNREMSLPQEQTQYLWQDESWVTDAYQEMSYLYNGLIHQVTIYEPDSRLPMARYTYTYNTSWLNTEILVEHWDGTYWFFFSRWTQGYDQNGNPTENIIYLWTGSWTMMAGNRNTYVYNGNQWMTEKTGESYSAGSWYFSSHEIYTIDGNGYPTEILYQFWNSGWYDSDRKKDIVWHAYSPYSGSGTFEFFIWESWSETEWTPEVRETTTYDGSGGFVRVQESWNGMGWVNALKETLIMNWGLVQEDKVENWAGNQWIQASGYRYFYTFSGNDMTEKIVQSFDAQYSDYINSLKYVYNDFLHVVGLYDPVMSDRQILVYPNPLKTSFSVDCTGFQSDAEIRINSLDGKMIGLWNVNFNDQPVQLDLDQSRLIKGIYLLTITGKNWSGFQKIVIE